MTPMNRTERRNLLVGPLRELAGDAGRAAAANPLASDEWHFYDGVRRAAEHALHAEMRDVQTADSGWLGRQSPSFREGYLAATTAINTAFTAEQPPVRIPTPSFRGLTYS